MTGTLPSEFGLATSMQKLKLSGNSFSGSLPAALGSWTNLEHADFSKNSFQGAIPDEIFALTTRGNGVLEHLNVTGNTNLTGNIPLTSCLASHFACSKSLCGCNCACPADSTSPP